MFLILFLFLFFQTLSADVYKITQEGCKVLKNIKHDGNVLPDSLVIAPGNYIYDDEVYNFSEDALYLNIRPPYAGSHRIVYTGDVINLLHAVSWIHVHGYKHDFFPFKKALEVAKNGKLHMTCGFVAQFTESLFLSLGIPCRFILLMTLDEWDTYSNGHSLIEIFENDKWVLYDIDLRSFFTVKEKKLNAYQFVSAAQKQNFKRRIFSRSPNFAFGDLTSQDYDFSNWYQVTFLFENILNTWYKRVAQVLCVREKGIFYFTCDQNHRTRVESYPSSGPFVFLEKNEFMNKFYPE